MTRYEFRTVSRGKIIWTVEHYCLNDAEALDHAENANRFLRSRSGKAT